MKVYHGDFPLALAPFSPLALTVMKPCSLLYCVHSCTHMYIWLYLHHTNPSSLLVTLVHNIVTAYIFHRNIAAAAWNLYKIV